MRRILWITVCASVVILTGCATAMKEPPPPPPPAPSADAEFKRKLAEAIARLNLAMKDAYERIIRERGTRTVDTPRVITFDALESGLTRLGMIVENRDQDIGVLTVAAAAPKPLNAAEWQTTVQSDQPLMASILCPTLGEYCKTIRFEPDDFVIVINATVRALDAGRSEVSLTTRMREIVERPGIPRRDYPPPTGVHMALDKIWAQFERALAERQPRSAGQRN
jgi:hypothetical protein